MSSIYFFKTTRTHLQRLLSTSTELRDFFGSNFNQAITYPFKPLNSGPQSWGPILSSKYRLLRGFLHRSLGKPNRSPIYKRDRHGSVFRDEIWDRTSQRGEVSEGFWTWVIIYIVGGCNPFEQICSSKWESSPIFGVKFKKKSWK